MGSSGGFFEKCGDFWFECRKIISDNIPDNLPVYLEITMDHLIPHAGNLPPCYVRMSPFERSGKIFDGFSDYFYCPYHCVCIIFVVQEIIIIQTNGNLPKKNNLIVDMG